MNPRNHGVIQSVKADPGVEAGVEAASVKNKIFIAFQLLRAII